MRMTMVDCGSNIHKLKEKCIKNNCISEGRDIHCRLYRDKADLLSCLYIYRNIQNRWYCSYRRHHNVFDGTFTANFQTQSHLDTDNIICWNQRGNVKITDKYPLHTQCVGTIRCIRSSLLCKPVSLRVAIATSVMRLVHAMRTTYDTKIP